MSPAQLRELALFTENVDGLVDFYERVLGLTPAERSEGDAVFPLGELVLRIHAAVETAPDDPPAENHVAFSVSGLDAHAASLAAAGFELDGPRDLPWGRSAYLRDPDGNLVELVPG